MSEFAVMPDDLSVLIRVAELGSFSAVARERGLPTSSISRAVQRLEKAWQVRLLRRSTHGLSITPEGGLAIELGRQSLATLRELRERLAQPTQEVSGTVRLALSAAFAESVVVPALPRLAERHPALCVELVAEDQATNLSAAGVDLALRAGKVVDEGLVARQIGHFRRGLYCSVDYARRRGMPRRPEALADHDLIGHMAARNLNRFRLNVAGQVEEWEIRGRYGANTTALICQMVLQGLGIGNLTDLVMQPLIRAGRAVEVLSDWRDPTEYPIFAVYLPDRQRLPRVEAVVSFFQEALGSK